MSSPAPDPLSTELLRRAEGGDARAREQLLELLYRELRQLAQLEMRSERGGHTLQPTALVHEAWLRLVDSDSGTPWSDRSHFLALASRAMRRVLVDYARRRHAEKRGGAAQRAELADDLLTCEGLSLDMLALDEALDRLAARDAELARVVELRFFGGLTNEETGRVLALSERQVEGAWVTARGWLRRELERQGGR